MATGYKVGRHIRIFIDPLGAASGVYAELDVTKNPSFSSDWDAAEVADRVNNFKRFLKGLRDVPLDIEMNMKTGDTNYEAMRTAHESADAGVIGLAIATGLMTDVGEHMFEADWEVMSWSESAAIGDTVVVTAGVKLAANTDFEPLYSVIAAGP